MSGFGGFGSNPDNFSDKEFRNFGSFPNENTLTVNVTHQQLSKLDPPFSKLVALSPTRYEEGKGGNSDRLSGKGYDVKLKTAKEIVFQHKAPDNAVVRAGKKWLNFKIDTKQLVNLATQYNPKEAFYALPVTPRHQQIRDGLERTVFVDVWSVLLNSLKQLEETSRIYVEYLPDLSRVPMVKGKYKTLERSMNGYPYYDLISTNHFHGDSIPWSPIERKLKKCDLGLPIRGLEEASYPFQETQRYLPGFDSDYANQFNPAYREHLKRRFVLNQLSTGNRSQELFDWLYDSMETQLNVAWNNEWVSRPRELEFESEIVREWFSSKISEITDSRFPLTYRLNRTQRCILEKGEEASEATI